MTDKLHSLFTTNDGIHIVQAWDFDDNSARATWNYDEVNDVGKIARMLDDGSFWLLTGFSEGPSWAKLSPIVAADVYNETLIYGANNVGEQLGYLYTRKAELAADVAFTTSVPFFANSYMPEQRVSGPLAFTVDSAGAIKGGAAYVRLIANGTNVPTFSGMSEHGSSMGYDGRAGIANLITFWWDGSEYFYSIAQSVNATPQLLGNSLRLSSGAMSESGSAKSWVYTGAAGFSSRESSAKTMPADGTFGFQIGTHGTAHTATVALNTYSAPTTNWTAVSFGLYGDTPSGNWMVLKTGSPGLAANGNAALPHAVGDQARMRRAGSSIFCEVSKDNGATWTLVHTFSGVAAGTLYPSVFSFGQASVAIGTYEIGLP